MKLISRLIHSNMTLIYRDRINELNVKRILSLIPNRLQIYPNYDEDPPIIPENKIVIIDLGDKNMVNPQSGEIELDSNSIIKYLIKLKESNVKTIVLWKRNFLGRSITHFLHISDIAIKLTNNDFTIIKDRSDALMISQDISSLIRDLNIEEILN